MANSEPSVHALLDSDLVTPAARRNHRRGGTGIGNKVGAETTLTATLTAKVPGPTIITITTGGASLVSLTVPAGAISGTASLTGSRAGTSPITATHPSGVQKTTMLTVTP